MNPKKALALVIGIVVILLLAKMGKNQMWKTWGDSPASPIVLGAVLPITGDGGFWGEHTRNAITLAVDEVNKQGGVQGKKLEIVIEDSKCDSAIAVSAIRKLLSVNKVPIVLGDVCSSATLAMAPVAQQAKIVLMTPCSEAAAIKDAGDFIFRSWAPNDRQVNVTAQSMNKRGLKKVAILAVNNDFGLSFAENLAKQFEASGGKVAVSEKYEQKDRDMRTQLLRIKTSGAEAIYLASYIPDGVAAVQQARQLGIGLPIYATSGINSPDFFKPMGPLAEGIIFADLRDTTAQDFRDRYAKTYGEWPGASSCAGVTYDDVMLFAQAINQVGTDAAKIRDYLSSVKNYPGVSGNMTFDANGDLDRQHAIFMVKNGQPELINENSF